MVVNSKKSRKALSAQVLSLMLALSVGCQGEGASLAKNVELLGDVKANDIVAALKKIDGDAVGQRAVKTWRKKSWSDLQKQLAKSASAVRDVQVNFDGQALVTPSMDTATYAKHLSVFKKIGSVGELTSQYKVNLKTITAREIVNGAKMVHEALNMSDAKLASLGIVEIDSMLQAQVKFLEAMGTIETYQDTAKMQLLPFLIPIFAAIAAAAARAAPAIARAANGAAKAASSAAKSPVSHPLAKTAGEKAADAVSAGTKWVTDRVVQGANGAAASVVTTGVIAGGKEIIEEIKEKKEGDDKKESDSES